MKYRSDYYQILGIQPTDGFHAVKRAYYRRAKQCHPDRFGGCAEKEEEFKRLVEAFDVLSDPIRRREYDEIVGRMQQRPRTGPVFFFTEDPDAIMDTLADDILEELIVGNTIPLDTTLQTLMQDLEQTERFCLFREGKTYFFAGRFKKARDLFEQSIEWSTENIIYRYYLAQTLLKLGKRRRALKQLKTALLIGSTRCPPQRLRRIRKLADHLRDQRRGFLKHLFPASRSRYESDLSPEDEMCRQIGRQISRMAKSRRPGAVSPRPPVPRRLSDGKSR